MSESIDESVACDVGIVCVTHRSGALIEDFAAAIPPAAGSLQVRIVVVDSGSPDDTVAVVRRVMPAAEVIELGANRGYAAAINAGAARARAAGASAVLVVNPDVRLGPGSLPVLVAALCDASVGIAVPALKDEHGNRQWSLRRAPSVGAAWAEALIGGPRAARWGLPTEVIRDPATYDRTADVDWATGGALLVSGRAFDAAGEWDESYFLYEEEVDFCLRMARAGLVLRYRPDATAVRLVGDGGEPPWVTALIAVNRVAHVRCLPGGWWRAPLVRLALIVGCLIRAPRARGQVAPALWALSFPGRGPSEVMQRYLPAAHAQTRRNVSVDRPRRTRGRR